MYATEYLGINRRLLQASPAGGRDGGGAGSADGRRARRGRRMGGIGPAVGPRCVITRQKTMAVAGNKDKISIHELYHSKYLLLRDGK
ncbi:MULTISPECIES: hypothetical protein [Methylobacterium]|uniref:hypothetical protein n=1 Tax=Methylobacterium TaxID=407 RepID=UPI0013EA1FD8|nr:hypothetical protein [Methylobacterium sp. DB0501]NGM35705.1 hypothetical protein [Methylobacterium sp. DB0501]